MERSKLDNRLKKALLNQANIKINDCVLDFRCGTGTLAIMMKKKTPQTTVHEVDVDPYIIEIARKKICTKGHEIILREYDGSTLPYKNETFHKVVSSFE